MSESMHPEPSRELAAKRFELAPDIQAAFDAFSQRLFADGAPTTIAQQQARAKREEVI